MTTAHRPTFDPARGKDALRGPAYHQRLLPAHTQLKFRQTGQGGEADEEGAVDLRAELLAAEEAHYAKLHGIRRISSNKVNPSLGNGAPSPDDEDDADEATVSGRNKRRIEAGDGDEESAAAKRRRILEESRDVDADDSDGGGGGSDDGDDGDGGGSDKDDEDDDDDDDDSDEDSDDDDAILQRELEKIKRERAEKHAKEEATKAAAEEAARERDIALGNPLLNKPTDFNIKRRWDDDVVFKNQARGTEEKGKKKEFINDLLRSDFHKRFMSKYVQ